jgi:hypothetical protein
MRHKDAVRMPGRGRPGRGPRHPGVASSSGLFGRFERVTPGATPGKECQHTGRDDAENPPQAEKSTQITHT